MRIGKGSQSFVFLLSSSVPETQVDMLAVDLHGSSVVVKDSGNIVRGEFVLSVANEDAGLADGTVTNYHQLDRNRLLRHNNYKRSCSGINVTGCDNLVIFYKMVKKE